MKPSPVWHFFQTPHTVGIDQDVSYAWSNNAAHGSPSGTAHSRYLKKMKTELMTTKFKISQENQGNKVLRTSQNLLYTFFYSLLCFFLIFMKHRVFLFHYLQKCWLKKLETQLKLTTDTFFFSQIFFTRGLPLLIAGLKMQADKDGS